MNGVRFLKIAALAIAMMLASQAFAQEKTGSIGGTIVDPAKAPIPGVTVTIASPALIGTKTAVTDSNGEYLIQFLPPGIYTVRTTLAGFSPLSRPGIEVRVGQTATVNLRMAMAAVSETTTVTGEPPVIDFRNTSRNFTIDAKAVQLIPITTDQTYTDLWVMAPGVRDSLASFSSTVRAPSINGAAVTQNKVFVDGIDAGDHVNAGTSTLLNQAVIQEVGISTGGFEAQAGFGDGGLMNIVTQSGGNSLKGGASLTIAPKRFNDTNVPNTQPADVATYFPEVHVGGPIVRDRMWFFISDKYLHESRGIFNVKAYRTENRSHEMYGKVTYAPSEKHYLTATYERDRERQDPSFGTASFTYDATPVGFFGGYMTGINWDYQISNQTLMNVLVSYFDKPNTTNGRNGSNPRTQYANAAGQILVTDGNYDRDQTNEQTRPYITGSFSHNFTLVGTHDMKVSTEWYPRTRRLNRLRMNEVRIYRDSPTYGPKQLWRVMTPRPADEVDNDTVDRGLAVAFQDSWRPLQRLTVNAGLRYEKNHTELVGRAEPLLDYDSWSPRLGLAYQIDDKTVIKSSASRIGEKFALDFAFSFFPNSVVFDTAESSKVNGELDSFVQGAAAPATTMRNLSRSVPSVWEYVIGVQRQLPGKFAVDVSYVQRQYSHFVDMVDRNLILDIPNKKFVGRVDPKFDALIDIVDTNRVHRHYRSVQIWANRRFADRWQFNGTYTYAIDRQDGEFGYGTTANAALQFAYGDRASDFFKTETGGRHNLKLSGSYTFPWNITAGVYYSKFSDQMLYDTYQQFPAGTPVPKVTLSNGRVVNDPLFNPILMVGPPSAKIGRRVGGTELFNFQLQKGFAVAGQQFRVTALIYNLFNAATRTNYLSTDKSNPNYNVLSGAQRPRSGEVAVGWEF